MSATVWYVKMESLPVGTIGRLPTTTFILIDDPDNFQAATEYMAASYYPAYTPLWKKSGEGYRRAEVAPFDPNRIGFDLTFSIMPANVWRPESETK